MFVVMTRSANEPFSQVLHAKHPCSASRQLALLSCLVPCILFLVSIVLISGSVSAQSRDTKKKQESTVVVNQKESGSMAESQRLRILPHCLRPGQDHDNS